MGKRNDSWFFSITITMQRRQFLATTSAALAATAISGCKSANQPVLRIYTWADYLDPSLEATFEKEHSCKIQIDTFDSNEAMYSKLSAGATGYDILMPSSYMVKTLIRENKLISLDHAKLPNLKHIDATYLKSALDARDEPLSALHDGPHLHGLAWLQGRQPGILLQDV
jgi:spermidine/putrescine transport system substrate-binding protein